eukprot:gene8595-biopygen4613
MLHPNANRRRGGHPLVGVHVVTAAGGELGRVALPAEPALAPPVREGDALAGGDRVAERLALRHRHPLRPRVVADAGAQRAVRDVRPAVAGEAVVVGVLLEYADPSPAAAPPNAGGGGAGSGHTITFPLIFWQPHSTKIPH